MPVMIYNNDGGLLGVAQVAFWGSNGWIRLIKKTSENVPNWAKIASLDLRKAEMARIQIF